MYIVKVERCTLKVVFVLTFYELENYFGPEFKLQLNCSLRCHVAHTVIVQTIMLSEMMHRLS